jgi:fructose-1,6-bisphosphatase
VSVAVKQIASQVARAGLDGLLGITEAQGANASGDTQKKLDVVAVRRVPVASCVCLARPG